MADRESTVPEPTTAELVRAWLEARDRRDRAEMARLDAQYTRDRAQEAETAAQVALLRRLEARLDKGGAYRLQGCAYWSEGGRVRELWLDEEDQGRIVVEVEGPT